MWHAGEAPKFMSVLDSDKIMHQKNQVWTISTVGEREGGVGVMLVFNCDLEANKGQGGQSRA